MRRPTRSVPSRVRAVRGFTLTELLVAVGVLVVVIVASARIFSASSKVAAIAEANADLLQTAAAIESQLRTDVANIPNNSFMVIQQVEVNPSNGTIDPSVGVAEVRADQIAFFSRGFRPTQRYVGSQDADASGGVIVDWLPQSAVARIYYGHGVVAPNFPANFGPTTYASGADEGAPVVPWVGGAVETQNWITGAFGPTRQLTAAKTASWPLARMSTLLATDGVVSANYAGGDSGSPVNATQRLFTSKSVVLGPLSTGSLPANLVDPLWLSGRVDVVKWQPDDLFSQTAYQFNQNGSGGGPIPFMRNPVTQPWAGPSSRLRMIQTLAAWSPTSTSSFNGTAGQLWVAYPRVEKAGLSASRADQMLTSPVLAPNCSSFKVEWTWADGVGRAWTGGPNPNGNEEIGMFQPSNRMQQWFGLDDLSAGLASSAVRPVSNWFNFIDGATVGLNGAVGRPLAVGRLSDGLVTVVEGAINGSGGADVAGRPVWRTTGQGNKRVYQAVFGLNQEDPSVTDPFAGGRGPYTPLPSALRFTVRLHDPLGRMEGGREFQFIVDLPRR